MVVHRLPGGAINARRRRVDGWPRRHPPTLALQPRPDAARRRARWRLSRRRRPASRELWFESYVQTYMERDIRALTQVRNLNQFRRFLALVASRHGQLLNKTDLAAPLRVSVPTIGEWLDLLEVTGQILVVPPYFQNFGKRILKSPKV